jgi:hypothetical protein
MNVRGGNRFGNLRWGIPDVAHVVESIGNNLDAHQSQSFQQRKEKDGGMIPCLSGRGPGQYQRGVFPSFGELPSGAQH